MAPPLRIAVGQLSQEANHFAPGRTELPAFERRGIRRGKAVLHGWGEARTEVPGFLAVLGAAGAEAVPLLCASAESGPPVSRAVFEALLGEILDGLRAAGRLDGALLSLHGAMAVEDQDDPEGEILSRVRAVLPPGTPVGASLDLHGHVTPEMLQPDVHLIGYREYPHIDMYETGVRTAEMLLDRLSGRRRPVMALAKRPMVVSASCARTVEPPLSEVVAEAGRMIDAGEVLHAALFPVQPWLDLPGLGFAALVCADGDQAAAQAAADRLAEMAWQRRERFVPHLTLLDEAVRIGLAGPGMTLVGDPGDAPTSGAPADRPDVLRALLAAGADRHDRPVLLTLHDAPAVQAAVRAGIGGAFRAEVGHSVTEGPRIAVEGRVRLLSDGRYVMRGPGASGLAMDHGPSAVVDIGAIRLALRSAAGWEWDPEIYRHLGLDAAHAAIAFVKSPGHFRVAFGPLAARTLVADTEGPACANMLKVPWQRVSRPLWPLDRFEHPAA